MSTNWFFDDAGFLYKVDSQRYGVSLDTHNYSGMDGLGQTLVGQIQTETVRRDMGTSGIQNVTNSFQYDDLYRLMAATVEGASSEWEYDNVGNRLSQTVGSTTNSYLYDANRLSSVHGVTATHDANGNLTAYNGNTYTWDVRGRLSAMTAPGLTASFDYDFLDRRAYKQINATPRTFRWDGDDLVNDTSGTHTRWTLQGPTLDEPLAQYDSYFPDGLYVTPNHLGSSTTLTDLNGWPQNWCYYQPFGQTSQSNTNFDNWGRFRFTGREADETGLYYYRARYYSPDLGRFISEDPSGAPGTDSQYAYAENSPASLVDPLGLAPSKQHQQRCKAILKAVYSLLPKLDKRADDYSPYGDALGGFPNGSPGLEARLTPPRIHWDIIQRQRDSLERQINEYARFCDDDDDDPDHPSPRLPWAQINRVLSKVKNLLPPMDHEDAMEIWRRSLQLAPTPRFGPLVLPEPLGAPSLPAVPAFPEVPIFEPVFVLG